MKVPLAVNIEVDIQRLIEQASESDLKEMKRLIECRMDKTSLTDEELEKMKDPKNLIEVVKMVKCRTQLPLKEAKVLVDKFRFRAS